MVRDNRSCRLSKPESRGHGHLSPDPSPASSSTSVMDAAVFLSFSAHLVSPRSPSLVPITPHHPSPPFRCLPWAPLRGSSRPFPPLLPWPPSQIMAVSSCSWPAAMTPALSRASLTILCHQEPHAAPVPGPGCSLPPRPRVNHNCYLDLLIKKASKGLAF